MKRSSIIAGIAAAIVGGQAVYLAAAGKGELLRPPGAQSESDFMARCVKCGKCLEACPYRAVHVAPGNAGAAAGTPVIDAREHNLNLHETLRQARSDDGSFQHTFEHYVQKYQLPIPSNG